MLKHTNNILLFGSSGQVGSNLKNILSEGAKLYLPTSKQVDFSNTSSFKSYLESLLEKPDLIINAAAYTAVDKAESETEICDNVNHKSVEVLADFCAKNNIPLIHYSTDYVYSGSGEKPFKEDDISDLKPASTYSKSKLAGDIAIQNSGCHYIILRTSWVYNHSGYNFVKTMLKLASERDELKVVNDQIGSPTYAADLAEITDLIISKLPEFDEFPSGVYNACPNEYISWFEFAKKAISIARNKGSHIKIKDNNIKPITTVEYPTPAKRPLNSRMNAGKLSQVFKLKFPDIDTSLAKAINKMEL